MAGHWAKQALSIALIFQFTSIPVVLAQPSAVTEAQVRKVRQAALNTESRGWEYFTQAPVAGLKVTPSKIGDLLQGGGPISELYAITHVIPDLGGRVGLRVQSLPSQGDKTAFVLTVFDRNFSKEISSRHFEFDARKTAAQNLRTYRRTMQTLQSHVESQKSLLSRVQDRLIPSAHAVDDDILMMGVTFFMVSYLLSSRTRDGRTKLDPWFKYFGILFLVWGLLAPDPKP
jgi:hypothetical protein